jgi:hypothetical protein
MGDEDGALTLELQAEKIAQNATMYRGSAPCPQCGVIMNPVQAMYSKGMCADCFSQHSAKRLKDRMA